MKKWKKTFILIVFLTISGMFLLFISNAIVINSTRQWHSAKLEEVPTFSTCLVLGTSQYLKNGYPNLYFSKRIEACERLWKSGKVKKFIVSGDNRRHSYNEAFDMRIALIRCGIPDSCIHPDYAGIRTLDSVVRSKEIFGQDSILIVSQEFHNQRAIYIAQNKGIFAFGYDASDVNLRYGFKTKLREYFARVKVLMDIHITHKNPRHLGEKIHI